MSDPTAYVAGQLAEQAGSVTGQTVDQDELAQAAHAAAGSGVTEADIDAIRAQLASFQAQLDKQAAASAQATPDALTGQVGSLNDYLLHHGDPVAKQLGQDAADAAKSAASDGNTGPLSAIVAKIRERLEGNPPYPGENFHYHSAVAVASDLPRLIERVGAGKPAA